MSNFIRHPYHLVNESPWPLVRTGASFITVGGLLKLFYKRNPDLLLLGLTALILTSSQWWWNVTLEATYQGLHSSPVALGMRWGITLFILSEVFFFLSFFWAFFHARLSPRESLGASWPPQGISPFNCFKVPLLNTLILLSSGVSVTWAHHSIIQKNLSQVNQGLTITVLLGAYFSAIQGYEYYEAPFRIADRSYGSSFFLATGFHGLHVLVGTLFLITMLARSHSFNFSNEHHFGFEAASWYWHFVDVVWLFLYVSVYWWGGA